MALNIKDPAVDRLAREIALATGETKTAAIRRALEERKQRLAFRVTRHDRRAALERFLVEEVWPHVPKSVIGRRLGRKEEERILGFGKAGV